MDDKARQGTPARKRDWEKQNPPHQKFTKTDLAKFEHAWQGLPQLVCLGAEKNFVKFAERMEDDGEPPVDLNFFKQTVAKGILWRRAEKLFDTLNLEGYRANSVAYAVAWLAEKSGRRIDLNRVWNEQRITPALCEAVKTVCNAAWEHLNHQQGNVGEASKKADCWESFRKKDVALSQDWEAELSDQAFVAAHSEEEALAAEWERRRHAFISDTRTIEGLEAYTGKEWIRTRRRDTVSSYAALTWEELRRKPGLGLVKIWRLLEMLAIAAEG